MLRLRCCWLFALGALAAAAFTISATPADAAQPANVRFVQAAPDVPPVDIAIDGKVRYSQQAFGAVSEYATLPAGKHQINVSVTSAGMGQNLELNAAAGGVYTIGLVGQLSELRLLAIADHPVPPSEQGPQLRVYNFSPDAPAVDVRRSDPQAPIGSLPTLLIANVGFAAGSGYFPVPSGAYSITVMPATIDYLALNTPPASFQASNDALQSMFVLKTLSQQSTIEVKIVPDTVLNRPSALPNTGASQPAPHHLAWLALLLVLCGCTLRRRAYS